MRWYPVCIKIEQRPCLVVGGGAVALAKARNLHRAGASLAVVAPAIDETFDELEGVILHKRPFASADVEMMFLVIAATDCPDVNRDVARACAARDILCCVVDQPQVGDFIVPAAIERGDFMLLVASGGSAPALSRRIRRELEEWLPPDFAEYVAFLGIARQRAQSCVNDTDTRKRLATWLASPEGYAAFAKTALEERDQWLDTLIKEIHKDEQT